VAFRNKFGPLIPPSNGVNKMRPTINTLIICVISSIGILCCGCQDKAKENILEKAAIEAVDEAVDNEISNHLDLEVVISVFGESENLEDSLRTSSTSRKGRSQTWI
jgi:hypothetical protein